MEKQKGIFLWGSGGNDEIGALTPEKLAGYHPLWANDVNALGPWSSQRLPMLEPENPQTVWKASRGASDTAVFICGRCPSSMDVAWRLEQANALPEWSSVIAVEQMKGRGRWHRRWVSTAGNLHVTWVWPQSKPHRDTVLHVPSLLSLVVGYMLASALENYHLDVQIKWPNDLFWNGGKLGGILIEQRNKRTLVGIGLNVVSAPPNDILEREGAPPAVSLAQAGLALPPMSAWQDLSRWAKACLENQLGHLSPRQFIALLEKRLAGLGQTVLVQTAQEDPFKAVMVGLAPDGGLILKRNDDQTVLYSGSILFF